MNTVKYVTIDYVIEQTNKILGFSIGLSKEDVAELVFSIITRLADPSLLITRITDGKNGPSPIDIINHRGLLPLDLVEVINHTIRNYDTKIKLIPSANPFFLSDIEEDDDYITDDADVENALTGITGEVITQKPLEEDPLYVNTASTYISPAMKTSMSSNIVDKYVIQDGEVITTIKEGRLELTYKAFPLDNNGFPKIPDIPKLIELVKWTILERAGIQLWYADKINERKYRDIKRNYYYAKTSASNQLKVDSIPEMEAFKNRFMRINVDPNMYANDFINFGYEDNLRVQEW